MGRTIAELEETMTEEEFHRWALWDQIEPIGQGRLDYMLAQIAWMTYHAAPGRKRPQKVTDFIPFGVKADPQLELEAELKKDFTTMKGPVRGKNIPQAD